MSGVEQSSRRGVEKTNGAGGNDRLPDGVVLSIDDLWVEFQTPAGAMQAVRGATLGIRGGGAVALIGGSGSGKTTLGVGPLRLLARAAGGGQRRGFFRAGDGGTPHLFSLRSGG